MWIVESKAERVLLTCSTAKTLNVENDMNIISSHIRETYGSFFCRVHLGLDYECVRTSYFWFLSSVDSLRLRYGNPLAPSLVSKMMCLWSFPDLLFWYPSLPWCREAGSLRAEQPWCAEASGLLRKPEGGPGGRFPCKTWPCDHPFLCTHSFLCLPVQGQGRDCPPEAHSHFSQTELK